MKKQDLYKELRMDEFFWGGSFIVDRDKVDSELIKEIDRICVFENKTPLAEKWKKLNLKECSDLLLNAFNFDLAYQGYAIMTTDKAEYYKKLIVSKFDESDTKCFTNWCQNPWKSKNGASWNSVTENTFDMAIVLADKTKIAFTYFISED
ncbi:hypothetical protein [Flavobacterium sp.]|uniref:hypothetical protein n=2 Tax=Flavobacterium sp. TaxID=239 RepID=UPI0040480BB7